MASCDVPTTFLIWSQLLIHGNVFWLFCSIAWLVSVIYISSCHEFPGLVFVSISFCLAFTGFDPEPLNGGVYRCSHLYGSASARNLRCSRGLALTFSSLTTTWEGLQSHSTSVKITWEREKECIKATNPSSCVASMGIFSVKIRNDHCKLILWLILLKYN